MAKSLYVTDSDNGQVLEKRDVYHNETDGTLHLRSLKVTGSMHTTPCSCHYNVSEPLRRFSPLLCREQSFSADTGVADHAREPGQASGSSGGESASGENRGM